MANPPRLTKLGAKWVEVTKRRAEGVWAAWWERIWKRGQQHPLDHRSHRPTRFAL